MIRRGLSLCRMAIVALWTAALTRPGLALGALALSAGAGVVFSAMLGSIILYLQAEQRSDDLAMLAGGLLLVLSLIMFSLHRLLGSKQAIELEFWKIRAKVENGEDVKP